MHREVEQVAGDAVYGLPSICLQFYLFTPARRALSFSSIPWETLAFRIVLVCRCAHDQQRQRNAHQCFQLGDANCFERVDALRGTCYVGVSIRSCMTSL